jgi:WD40 repeat protein
LTAAAPYPGLRPFHPDEVDVFFGREEQIDQLLERLDRSRLLAVVGLSGSGKSSLVKAGLIPALETGLLASAGARWRVAEMRPGEQPLRRLAEALLSDTALGPERGDDPAALGLLLATLRRGPLGLVEALADTPPPEGTRLLLVVDQFEEIFRYHAYGDSDQAEAFVALLLAAAARPDLPLYVVLTMRSDFLGDCALFEGLPEALNDCQFLTPRMTREQRRAAIVGPAGVFGAAIEPVLVNRLLNDMGDDPDQLPRMQHLLMRLWTRCERGEGGERLLTVADYEAVGGFEDALSRHADEAFEELDEEGRRIAERLFRALSERGDDQRDVRRPARLGEVAAVADVPPERVAEAVEVFRRPDRSFLIPPAAMPLTPETVLDVAHESLIRQWRRLRDWVEREALSAGIYRRLAETARLWKQGEAGLWGPPDLDVALAWEARQCPTEAWAERYGGDLATAMEFLAASREKKQRDEQAERRAAVAVEEERRVRQRNRLLTGGLLVAASLLLLSFWQWKRADLQRDLAERQTLLARAGELVAQAREASVDRPQLGLLLAAEASRMERDAGVSGAGATSMLQKALSTSGGRGLSGHRGPIGTLAVTPDGRYLATGSDDGSVRLWDLSADDPAAVPKVLAAHDGGVGALAMGPGGRWLASAGADGAVRLWDLGAADPAAAPRVLSGIEGAVTALAADPGGRWIAAGGEQGEIIVWDLAAADPAVPPRRLHLHRTAVTALAAGPDGRRLASGGRDHLVTLWDLAATGTADPVQLAGHLGPIEVAAFTPDGRWLATAARDNTARLWSTVDPAAAPIVLCGHVGSVVALEISADGHWLATGSSDGSARSWRLPAILAGAAARGQGGTRTVVAAGDSPVRCRHWLSGPSASPGVMWNLRDAEPPVTAGLDGHLDTVTALALSPVLPGRGLRFLATASLDHTVRIWGLAADSPGRNSVVLHGHDDAVRAMVFAPRAPHLFSGSTDTTARIWDLSLDSKSLFAVTLGGALDAVGDIDLTSDGRWVAAGSDDNDVHLWDLRYIEPPKLLIGHDSSLAEVEISADDGWLASSGLDGVVRLWDLSMLPASPTARELAEGMGPAPLAFAGAGRLAAGGLDGSTRLWRLDGAGPPAPPALLCGHPGAVADLAVSAGGRRLATVGAEGAVWLWDLEALAPLLPAPADRAPLLVAAIDEAGCRRRSGIGDAAPARAPDAARRLSAGGDPVTAAAFVPGAGGTVRWLATGDSGGRIALWPAGAGGEAGGPVSFAVCPEAVTRLAAGAEGRWLAVAGGETAYLVDLEAVPPGSRTLELHEHRDVVSALAFSPGDRWLATGSADGEARLWDLEAPDPSLAPGVLYGHQAAVSSVVFSPDGGWLITGGRDHTVRVWTTYLWSLDRERLVDLACRVAGRGLTGDESERYLGTPRGQPVCGGAE